MWRLWPELIKVRKLLKGKMFLEVWFYKFQTMHERLEEMNCPLPKDSSSAEGVDSDVGLNPDIMAMGDQEMGMGEGPGMMITMEGGDLEQPDFDFQLNMLPVWAQKAALSRPSVAQQAAASKELLSSDSAGTIPSVSSKIAEGKWAEVKGRGGRET